MLDEDGLNWADIQANWIEWSENQQVYGLSLLGLRLIHRTRTNVGDCREIGGDRIVGDVSDDLIKIKSRRI